MSAGWTYLQWVLLTFSCWLVWGSWSNSIAFGRSSAQSLKVFYPVFWTCVLLPYIRFSASWEISLLSRSVNQAFHYTHQTLLNKSTHESHTYLGRKLKFKAPPNYLDRLKLSCKVFHLFVYWAMLLVSGWHWQNDTERRKTNFSEKSLSLYAKNSTWIALGSNSDLRDVIVLYKLFVPEFEVLTDCDSVLSVCTCAHICRAVVKLTRTGYSAIKIACPTSSGLCVIVVLLCTWKRFRVINIFRNVANSIREGTEEITWMWKVGTRIIF